MPRYHRAIKLQTPWSAYNTQINKNIWMTPLRRPWPILTCVWSPSRRGADIHPFRATSGDWAPPPPSGPSLKTCPPFLGELLLARLAQDKITSTVIARLEINLWEGKSQCHREHINNLLSIKNSQTASG